MNRVFHTTSVEAIERKNCCCPSSNTQKTMDSSTEKHESMNPQDLSFTQIDSKSNFSDSTSPVSIETAFLIQQDLLDSAVHGELTAHTEFHQNSSTEKHESMNLQDLSFTQIDCKSNSSDPTCPVPETTSLMQEDLLDSAVIGEFTAHTQFLQNSSTEKHESMNPKDLSFTQIDSMSNFSDSTCSVPTDSASFIQQGQLDTARTEFHQLCLPRITKNVPSVSLICVSNTYKVADVTFFMAKSRDEMSGDRTPLPPISCQKETSLQMHMGRDETWGDRNPLPVVSWQKETSLRLMRVFGSVCAALFAAYWGWRTVYVPVNNDDN